VSAHIVSTAAAAVEQPFASPKDQLKAAREERRTRAAERKRVDEVHGRYKQAFNELATLEAEHGRDDPDVKAARAHAWAIASELQDERARVDRLVQHRKRLRRERAS
jgi:hypothetical protein